MKLTRLGLRRRLPALGTGVVALAALLAGLLAPAAAQASPRHAAGSVTDYVTFYGYVDNSPPGRAIAHPCIHRQAGGTGTYADPVTFAEHIDLQGPWCQIIYVPFLHKYFIHEDQCNPCGGVPNNHVDLWMGGDSASTHNPEKHALLSCENTWTRHAAVILNPPSTEPVDTTPMFSPPTTCYGGG